MGWEYRCQFAHAQLFGVTHRSLEASEDLNGLVKRHIQSVVSASPSKAISTLEHDASELIANGMVTLHSKLTGVEEEELVDRVVEVWRFFWDDVLPYVEGVRSGDYLACGVVLMFF